MSSRTMRVTPLLVLSLLLSLVVVQPAAALCFQSKESSGSEPVRACQPDEDEIDAEAMLGARVNAARADAGAAGLEGWFDLLIAARWWAAQPEDGTDPDIDVHVGHHQRLGSLVATVELADGTPTEAELSDAVDAAIAFWQSGSDTSSVLTSAMWEHLAAAARVVELSVCDPDCRDADALRVVVDFRDPSSTPPSPWTSYPIDGGRPPRTLSASPSFGDVPFDHTFHRDIDRLAHADVTRGCNREQTLFCPDDGVTRGQMAAFLTRALDLPGASDRFADVPSDHTFVRDIAALSAADVTKGCNPSGSRFCPERVVTRAEMAAFLVRALDLPTGTARFEDVGPGHTFRADIAALADAGITRGCNRARTRFCPDAPVTRAQMAAFLARAGILDPGADV